jgi:hypothetical protein
MTYLCVLLQYGYVPVGCVQRRRMQGRILCINEGEPMNESIDE